MKRSDWIKGEKYKFLDKPKPFVKITDSEGKTVWKRLKVKHL